MNLLHDLADLANPADATDATDATDAPLDDDLSTLAWVHDELRRSLEAAHKALRRQLKEAQSLAGSDVDAVDPAVLRNARAQLHQAVGALQMIGLPGPARVLQASESAVQRFIARPRLLTREAFEAIESASFGVLDYLGRKLAGKGLPTLALFAQYSALQPWAGGDRVHPADLWREERPWQPRGVAASAAPTAADASVRAAMETLVLATLRGADSAALQRLSELCAGLGAAGDDRLAELWRLAAAFYEAQAGGLLASDVFTKRLSSRLLAQLRLAIGGHGEVSDRLAQDVLFFCAQAAAPGPAKAAPRLQAVRECYALEAAAAFDYQVLQLGRFDPAWITQARKRVAAAKQVWSALADGDAPLQGSLAEPFALVGDSLKRLFASGEVLAEALLAAVAQTQTAAEAPRPALAMEVATAVLYLEAALEDAEFEQPQIGARLQRLAQRICDAAAGAAPQPLEPWMEELYRRVSDRQTMGSVVHELRASLSEVEKQIDQYFRDPAQRALLIPVPAQLQAMRGVLSLLGIEQASHAVKRMSEDVDALAATDIDPQHAAGRGTFTRLADNLGALSFMIDMLSVQPRVARSLFRYDPASGNLSAVMGRRKQRLSAFGELDDAPAASTPQLVEQARSLARAAAQPEVGDDTLQRELARLSQQALLADQRALAQTMATAQQALQRASDDAQRDQARSALAQAVDALAAPIEAPPLPAPVRSTPAPQPQVPGSTGLEDDAEMRDIFIEEAREVIGDATQALHRLDGASDDLSDMTLIRRAFHTLKGSSRMVGLKAFGEAAWSCEQLYNALLADSTPLDAALAAFSADALRELGAWVDDIAGGGASARDGAELSARADALRQRGAAPPATQQGAGGDDLLQRVPDLPGADELQLDFGAAPGAAAAFDGGYDRVAAADGLDFVLDLGDDAGAGAGTSDVAGVAGSASPPALRDALEAAPSLPDDSAAPSPPQIVEAFETVETVETVEPVASITSVESVASVESGESITSFESFESFESIEPIEPIEPIESFTSFDITATVLALDAPDTTAAPEPAEPIEALPAFAALPACEPAHRDEPLLSWPDAAALDAAGLPDALEVEAAAHDAEPAPLAADDEQLKVIGHLRIGIALFNIYLNEADELSRRLCTELAEWSLQPERGLDDSTAALAHSLAGSSATVGYAELSALARALEHALMRTAASAAVAADAPQLLLDAAEEIRRLLHQFAAGFLRAVPAALLQRLEEHERGAPLPPPEPAADPAPAPAHEPGLELRGEPELGRSSLTAFAPLSPLPHAAPAAARAHGHRDSDRDDDDRDDDDSDSEAVDAIDAELFPIFREEAEELLPQLRSQLRAWAQHPSQNAAAAACLRTLHTFKGGARLAGAMRVGELAHRLEAAIEALLAHGHAPAAEIEQLLARVDRLSSRFEAIVQADAAVCAAAVPAAARSAVASAAPAVGEAPAATTTAAPASGAPIDWARFAAAPATALPAAERASAVAAVRVRAPLLDRLVNQAGEVSITRARIEADVGQIKGSLGDLSENLERLRRQLRDLELQAETQIASRMEAAKAASQQFDPLELDRFTRFQELTRMMAESVNDVATVQRGLQRSLQATEDELASQARLTRELQDDLLRTRMVEFDSLADRLYRVVRLAAKECAKQVRLDIVGGAIEIDRGVLERMTGPFEHLLRNCVAHGIEPAAQRSAAGKDATGRIAIQLAQEGNEVSVEFRDDGAGLDLARIRQRGIALGLLAADASPDAAELANLIFASGFSTAQNVSELAGRGVGMDVVRAEVNAMGGRIETATAAGAGTSFRLVLPLTTAVTQVVMLRAGALRIAVPSTLVEVVKRVDGDEIERGHASGAFAFDDKALPLFWLGALLDGPARDAAGARAQPVVVIRSAAQRVALHVDEVLGNQEVVVKNLGPQLARLPGLAGVTLLPSGEVALIYNPVALATLYGERARAQARRTAAAAQPHEAAAPVPAAPPLVLVVDDSLTVRRVTQRLLQREGYRVLLAKDGLDALDKLGDELPAVVLSDIEMPRMDGFDLLRNIRSDARLAALPVIMITSRIAQKHRDHAAQLGANHYLGKPYSEDELLGLLGRYVPAAAVH